MNTNPGNSRQQQRSSQGSNNRGKPPVHPNLALGNLPVVQPMLSVDERKGFKNLMHVNHLV